MVGAFVSTAIVIFEHYFWKFSPFQPIFRPLMSVLLNAVLAYFRWLLLFCMILICNWDQIFVIIMICNLDTFFIIYSIIIEIIFSFYFLWQLKCFEDRRVFEPSRTQLKWQKAGNCSVFEPSRTHSDPVGPTY